MATKNITCSIPDDMAGFLFDNPSLKPSHLLQESIQNIQNSLKSNPQLIDANKTVDRLNKVIQRLQDDLLKSTSFIEAEGLWEKFIKTNQSKLWGEK